LNVIEFEAVARELAEQAVKACKHLPLGVRGYGPARASSQTGAPKTSAEIKK
jgi:2-keto-3-deoxy-L-rhamnonate aldolase RhmA